MMIRSLMQLKSEHVYKELTAASTLNLHKKKKWLILNMNQNLNQWTITPPLSLHLIICLLKKILFHQICSKVKKIQIVPNNIVMNTQTRKSNLLATSAKRCVACYVNRHMKVTLVHSFKISIFIPIMKMLNKFKHSNWKTSAMPVKLQVLHKD